ncbi:MAG TPA: YkgJ family cysteine cluster protein [Urbifossiella sp.]|nr:YkgJ family cysteine cluster protein [Urbifossiella sp.]
MMPVRSLPVLQNWDCGSCSACCRTYHVPVSAEERKRIEGQGWEREAEMTGVSFFAQEGSWFSGRSFRLNHRADGACVFLGPDNRCRIHAKFGAAAKPLACRIYPFLLVPAGDHWRLGLRYACPSSAANFGQPLAEHLPEVRDYAAALESDSPSAVNAPPTALQKGQLVAWSDLLRIAAAVSKVLSDSDEPLERRWRMVLGLVHLCRGLKFDGGRDASKMITGGRLSEMLHVLSEAVAEETPASADEVPRPGWVGRIMFRQLSAVYTRKDHGAERGSAQRTPLGRIAAAIRFARGRGRVPALNALVPDTTFEKAEEPAGPPSAATDALLTRYYKMKVESLQFCGPTNFDLPFWDGLESLAMTFPAICWLGRVLAGERSRDEAITQALRLVDDNFGFNKLLGLGRQKFALRVLSGRGELARLVAWYSR